MGWGDDAAHRAKCLDALNEAERYIATQGSFIYLSKQTTITLVNTPGSNDFLPVPTSPAMDYGKFAVIRDATGILTYLPPDQFPNGGIGTAYLLRPLVPAVWTLGLDSGSVPSFFFYPANTSVGSVAYTLRYQRAVTDLTDAGNSYSLLPEGYEQTLLIRRAEADLRRTLNRKNWDMLMGEFDKQISSFYNGQRTSKESSKTDNEVAQRKQFDTQTGPDAQE